MDFRDRFATKYSSTRESVRTNRVLNATWKSIILVVGFSFIGLGVFFLIFPGPGWATIILGLIVLASEFAWARRVLDPVQAMANRLAEKVLHPDYKERSAKIAFAVVVGATAGVYVYLDHFGHTMAPVFDLLGALNPF